MLYYVIVCLHEKNKQYKSEPQQKASFWKAGCQSRNYMLLCHVLFMWGTLIVTCKPHGRIPSWFPQVDWKFLNPRGPTTTPIQVCVLSPYQHRAWHAVVPHWGLLSVWRREGCPYKEVHLGSGTQKRQLRCAWGQWGKHCLRSNVKGVSGEGWVNGWMGRIIPRQVD